LNVPSGPQVAAPVDVHRAGDVAAATRAHVAPVELVGRARVHQRHVAPAEALAHPPAPATRSASEARAGMSLDAGARGTSPSTRRRRRASAGCRRPAPSARVAEHVEHRKSQARAGRPRRRRAHRRVRRDAEPREQAAALLGRRHAERAVVACLAYR